MNTRTIRAAFIHPPTTAEQRTAIAVVLSLHRIEIARTEAKLMQARRRRIWAELAEREARWAFMDADLARKDTAPFIAAELRAGRTRLRARNIEARRRADRIQALAAFAAFCRGEAR